MVTPNKQNLLLLKNQLRVIKNGLILLREKRTGLVILFLELAKKGKLLEEKLGKNKMDIINQYTEALLFISLSSLKSSINKDAKIDLQISKKRVSGVYLENFTVNTVVPKRDNLKTNISDSLEKFSILFPDLLMLVQLKINVEKISTEIEKTNRLINNLERKTEETTREIKIIDTILSEKENLQKATIIKIFS